jgi:hypothetical protein
MPLANGRFETGLIWNGLHAVSRREGAGLNSNAGVDWRPVKIPARRLWLGRGAREWREKDRRFQIKCLQQCDW